jgi:hydroxymethylpyrimidine pyrophosphatase-like HAD family hydrolase
MSEFLLVADFDGSLTQAGLIPNEIVTSFRSLHSKGYQTTIVTARGFQRIKIGLGEYYDDLVSPDVTIGLENGGRIIDREGKNNLQYHPLTDTEVDKALEGIEEGNFEYVVFYPEDLEMPPTFWSRSHQVVELFINRFGFQPRILVGGIPKLKDGIKDGHPAMLTLKPSPLDDINLFPAELNLVRNEVLLNLNHASINKGKAVQCIAAQSDISLDRVLVVGNDHNDESMFLLPVGERIFVGTTPIFSVVQTRVSSAKELGQYLMNK